MSQSLDAIVFTGPGAVETRTFSLGECGPAELIVRTLYSLVSPGTELRLLSGIGEAEGQFPFIPGYALVGRVEQVGSRVRGWREGELVSARNPIPLEEVGYLWGGQAGLHRYEVAGDGQPVKLPAGADPWDYVLAEVGAISWRGVHAAGPRPRETAVVIGQGIIGALATKWLLHLGARVVVTDLVSARLERATRWGAAAVEGGRDDATESILALTDGGADIVIEASGSRAGVELASRLVRHCPQGPARLRHGLDAQLQGCPWPRLVYLASYTHEVSSKPGQFFPGEAALVVTPIDRTVNDRQTVVDLIRRGVLSTGELLDKPTPYRSAPAAYAALRDQPADVAAVAFAWE